MNPQQTLCCPSLFLIFFPIQKKKRRRIDRSMIGEPMNFVHLTHIGSGDMANEGLPMVSLLFHPQRPM
uniref:CRIB domain-containing protein n=1 Tax=Anolis carolinensis TaxID=28377 RepID=H9GUV0_ANOCA